MNRLSVPGATLAYTTRGRGPLFLIIPGATGTGKNSSRLAEHLAAHYTVITSVRSRFSASRLAEPPDDERRLRTDADDVRCLIQHFGDEPAIIFGSSSGAIIALTVLTQHPTVVRQILSFEPP